MPRVDLRFPLFSGPFLQFIFFLSYISSLQITPLLSVRSFLFLALSFHLFPSFPAFSCSCIPSASSFPRLIGCLPSFLCSSSFQFCFHLNFICPSLTFLSCSLPLFLLPLFLILVISHVCSQHSFPILYSLLPSPVFPIASLPSFCLVLPFALPYLHLSIHLILIFFPSFLLFFPFPFDFLPFFLNSRPFL